MRTTAPQRPTANKQGIAARSQEAVANVSYTDNDGKKVELSTYIINTYLAPKQDFTPQECWSLMNLSKARGLNPIAKDCYFVKYDGIPQVIISKDYYMKRANKNPAYLGKENGIVVLNRNGELEMRKGTIKLPSEELLGSWCNVYMANLKYPVTVTASLDEYAKKDRDGNLQSTWKAKTCVMIEKVAIVRALKEAMTEEFAGTYAAEEFGEEEETISADVKDVDEVVTDVVDDPVVQPIKQEPKPKYKDEVVSDAQYVDVNEATGEVVEEPEEDDFEDMQNSFFN